MKVSPFHFTIRQRKESGTGEGTYLVRLYTVPAAVPVKLADHWNWLTGSTDGVKNTTESPLDPRLMDDLGQIGVESESQFEQGIPKLETFKLKLLPDPVFLPLVQAARSAEFQVWIEVTLEQPALDIPDRSDTKSIVFPRKTRCVYWGLLNSPSLTGRVRLQKERRGLVNWLVNAIIREDKRHLGSLDMEFVHWIKLTDATSVKALLDSISSGFLTSPNIDALAFLLTLVYAVNPAPVFYVADHRLKATMVLLTFIGSVFKPFVGDLSIAISNDGTTWQTNLADIFFKTVWTIAPGIPGTGLFYIDAQGNTNDKSFYNWKDLAQGIAEFCREFFLDIQFELPTLAEAAAVLPNSFGFYTDTVQTMSGAMRVLLKPISEAPLKVFIDHDQEGIDYVPCGAFAASYKVDEPTATGIFPYPGYYICKSKMKGGSDQSYKTRLRFVGKSYSSGVLVDDPRGWEMYVKDSGGTLVFARHADLATITEDGVFPSGNLVRDDWAALHADVRMVRWGVPSAIATIKGKGVGVEPFGYSASLTSLPKKTFDLLDWGEFPLGRQIYLLPGILSTPGDKENDDDGQSFNARPFTTLGVRRTPGGGTEYKLVEQVTIDDFIVRGGVPVGATPPPPPGAPPNGPAAGRGGSSDAPTVAITSPLPGATVSGVVTIVVHATNATGVAQVTVQIDDKILDAQVATRETGDWSFAWKTSGLAGGAHTIKAIGYDQGGNLTSTTISVNI